MNYRDLGNTGLAVSEIGLGGEWLTGLATEQVEIDLDDGVKANYPKLGAALKKIPGLDAPEES